MKPGDVIATDNGPAPAWPMYRAMVGIGIFCALLIVSVVLWTLPMIEHNRAAALERAVLQVLPGASRFVRHDIARNAIERVVYVAFTAQGDLAGIALDAQAMGYQDTVRILYGYNPAIEAVVGMQVLETRETPGLGDRIETDPVFTANFDALDVRLGSDGDLANPIELVKPGQKTQAWQIDSISGATISSAAVAHMLQESTSQWIPELYRRQAELRALGENDNAQ